MLVSAGAGDFAPNPCLKDDVAKIVTFFANYFLKNPTSPFYLVLNFVVGIAKNETFLNTAICFLRNDWFQERPIFRGIYELPKMIRRDFELRLSGGHKVYLPRVS